MTTEETEKAKTYNHFLQQSKREYRMIYDAFRGRTFGVGFPYTRLFCCEDCPNKKACVEVTNEEYDEFGTLKTYSSKGTIMEEITEKLNPFIKENLKCLNLTDFDDWGVIDEF